MKAMLAMLGNMLPAKKLSVLETKREEIPDQQIHKALL